MKKVLLLLVIICLSFTFYACNNENNDVVEKDIFEQTWDAMNLPETTKENINLPTEYTISNQKVTIKWKSENVLIMTHQGAVRRAIDDQKVKLTCTITHGEENRVFEKNITVLAFTIEERLENVMISISIPSVIDGEYLVPIAAEDEEVSFSWRFSHPNILDLEGVNEIPSGKTEMTLTLTLQLNDKTLVKEFEVMAFKAIEIEKYNTQMIVDRDFSNGLGVKVDANNHLILEDGEMEGTYLSPIVYTSPFTELVGSWSAIANQETGSIKVSFRILVEGEWSDFFTYGKWRFGDKNRGISKTSANGVAKMTEDTIFPLYNKYGNAYQYKIEFDRISSDLQAPVVNLVAASFAVKDFAEPKLDYNAITQEVVYDVPKLYQREVPEIGGSICSPTSVTMLLKYKGHSFVDKGYAYEHEYIAINAKDYGHDIFGNWVYCVAVMGAHGEEAYVKYFANNDELIEHLINVGPVALSVKGNMQNIYSTGGHLLVCKGFRIENGVPVFICNDPALSYVEVEYTYETIENVWRKVAYVIE